ncbi:MAG: CHAT domain-containing tetratricopeptide repeat protein [Actinomycetota bacterium]
MSIQDEFAGEMLVALSEDDPRRAIDLAERLVSDEAPGPIEAYRALGLAHRSVGEPDASRRWLELGIEEAGRRDDEAERAELWITYSATLAMLGDFDAALELLDRAEATGDGAGRLHARVQRAGMLARRGHVDQALGIYEEAEVDLIDRRDDAWLSRLYNNRGLLRTFTGDLGEAERDLRQGLAACERLSAAHASAHARHNLGFVLTHRGELLEALDCYTEAADTFEALNVPSPDLPLDRCQTLMYAGLTEDALTIAAEAIEDVARTGMAEETAEGLLKYATVASAAGSPNAGQAAGRARDALSAIGNDVLADAASVIELRSRSLETDDPDGLLPEVARVADQLEERDRRLAGGSARLIASRVALDTGDTEAAAAHLERAEARLGVDDTGSAPVPMSLAVELALTSGLHAEARGDSAEASRLARRGLATVEATVAQIGFGGQQAYVRACARDLIRLQVRMALNSKGNARLFRWVEAGRTRFDRPPRLRRPDDEALADQLEHLRLIHAERAGDPDDPDLAKDQAKAERRMRSVVRRSAAAPVGSLRNPTVGTLKDALGSDAAYVSWFSPDESLWELRATDRGSRRRRIGPEAGVRTLTDQLALAMGSLAAGRPDSAAATESAGATLQEMLLPGTQPQQLILNPPSDLFNTPWTALPALTDAAVTIAPSAAAYLRPGPDNGSDRANLIMAGPDLERSEDEARLVASVYGTGFVDASSATAHRILDELAGARLAHFACHAVYRPDNAAFSYLRLTDGPLFLYDIERLPSGPATVVLSACSAGRSGAAGNQLHGFVTALLRAGVRTVIAPIVPVPDTDETLDLVDRLHRELQLGTRPAQALRRARSHETALASYTSHAFQCFGWG